MFDCYENRTTLVTIMSDKKGIDLKNLYAIENGLILDKITIRLIFRGFEITDDLILNKVKFDENSNISVLIRYLTITDEKPEQNILIAKNSKIILFEDEKNVEENLELIENVANIDNNDIDNTLMSDRILIKK